VRQPLEDSGTEAARRLCALLRGEPIGPPRQQLPLEVVHRSSTARLRVSRPSRAGAHLGKAARVAEVSAAGRMPEQSRAAHGGLATRALEGG